MWLESGWSDVVREWLMVREWLVLVWLESGWSDPPIREWLVSYPS